MTTKKITKPHLIRRSWLHGKSHDTIQFGLHNGKNKINKQIKPLSPEVTEMVMLQDINCELTGSIHPPFKTYRESLFGSK